MKILAIRGGDLASLAGDFAVELNQAPLSQAGVFAITGPTGSGKSTLLDALCLALFGSTPRGSAAGSLEVEGLTAQDARQSLRRGAVFGWAECDFEGIEGRVWRARWEVRRARGRSDGRVQEADRSLRSLDEDTTYAGRKAEVQKAIEERLGLGFTQFRQAVLLAQGEFQAFLRAGPGERAELLEAMTGTQVFGELGKAAFVKAKAMEEECAAAARALDAIEVLSPEQESALQEKLAKVRQELTEAMVQRQEWSNRLAQWEERRRREAECAAAQANLETHSQNLAARRREVLPGSAYDSLLPDWSAIEADFGQWIDVSNREKANQDLLESATKEQDSLLALQEEWARSKSLAAGELEKARQGLAMLRQQRQAIALEDVLRWRSLHESTVRAGKTARDDQERLELARQRQKQSLERMGESLREVGEMEATLPGDSQRLDSLKRSVEHLQTRAGSQAVGLRATLEEEAECPVCGSTHHPWAHDVEDEFRQAWIRAREELDNATSKIQKVQERFALSRAQVEASRREVQRLVEEVEELAVRAAATSLEAHQARSAEIAAVGNQGGAEDWERTIELAKTLDGRLRNGEAYCLEREKSVEAAATALEQVSRKRQELAERCSVCQAVLQEGARQKQELSRRMDTRLWHLETSWQAAPEKTFAQLSKAIAQRKDEIREMDALERQLEQLQARVRQLQEGLEALPTIDVVDDESDLRQKLANTEVRIEQSHQVQAELDQTLRLSKASRARQSEAIDRLARIKAGMAPWVAMRELIGSADGKKFRLYAQGLTLRRLLLEANHQLQELAPRYRLVPATTDSSKAMDLLVQDLELGGEHRSTSSLSGGETFLVSLGLSLGLSNMATHGLRLRTLFIDEGFGTLDPESLQRALSALDVLAMRGHQVGIITHVAGLAENLSARVRVLPIAPGRSRVVVEGL